MIKFFFLALLGAAPVLAAEPSGERICVNNETGREIQWEVLGKNGAFVAMSDSQGAETAWRCLRLAR
jgi:hypothetical protein